jgi:diadenosine tetraphosphatase ApaH/serine/threonine PP2A family protein phosphatase
MRQGWPTIAGNHERQLLTRGNRSDAFAAAAITPEQRAWVAALPAALALQGGDVQLVHGTPQVDHEPLLDTVTPDFGHHGSPGVRAATPAEVRERLGDAGAATLLLCGHSHQPRVLALGGLLIANPGSVGLPAYDHDQPHPHVVETGSPHARWAIVERTAAGWQVQQRLAAYDWHAAAAKAEAEGRGDWADALATGRVGRTESG